MLKVPKRKAYITNKKHVITKNGMIDIWQSPKESPIYAIGLDKKPRSKIGESMGTLFTEEEIAKKNKNNAMQSYLEFEHLVSNNFNPLQSLFLTFTFADTKEFDITNVGECNKRLTRFIDDKLRKKYGKEFKYVTAIEFQDKNKRGAVHYHMLIDMMKPRPYIDKDELAHMWGYGTTHIRKVTSARHSAVYVGKYMRKGQIDSRLTGQKKYWSSRNLESPSDQYGTNTEILLEFLDSLPDEQKEKYSESCYLSEYHGCEITHTRIFIPPDLAEQFINYIKPKVSFV